MYIYRAQRFQPPGSDMHKFPSVLSSIAPIGIQATESTWLVPGLSMSFYRIPLVIRCYLLTQL